MAAHPPLVFSEAVAVPVVHLWKKLLGIVEVLVEVHWQISQHLPTGVALGIVVPGGLEQVRNLDPVMPSRASVIQPTSGQLDSFS